MGLMDGKIAVIFGVANKRSIAWGITKALSDQGAKIVLNYQNERMRDAVEKLASDLPEMPYLAACDVTDEAEIDTFLSGVEKEFGHIDALVHSVAFAKRDELGNDFKDTSWEGYQLAQHVSAYSLISIARRAAPLMANREGSIVSMTYHGSRQVIEGYNVMGVAKAALEANTRYLAASLGPSGIRVNAVSAGPIKTVSAMGVTGMSDILDHVAKRAPLRRNVTQEEVGKTSMFLLSDLGSGITGQTIYVDCGFSILGA